MKAELLPLLLCSSFPSKDFLVSHMVANLVTVGRLETISAQATEKAVVQSVFQPRTHAD